MTESNTRSGIPLRSVYTPEDAKGQDYDNPLGAPGEYPYTRGRRATAVGGWMQREPSGEGEPCKARDSDENLVYATTEAFSAGATMGEIAGMMRMAYGTPYDPHRLIESPV